MKGGVEQLARRLRRFLRWAGPHPTPELLAAYRANELTPEQDEKIREHFLYCRRCPELLLDLQDFAAPERAEVAPLSETWVTGAWQRMRGSLAGQTAAQRVGRGPRHRLASPGAAYAAAGGLLLVAVGLIAWVTGLRSELRRLREPQANVALQRIDFAVRSAGPAGPAGHRQLVEIPPGGDRFVLAVATAADAGWKDCDAFRLALRTPHGRELWSTAGLLPAGDGNITLELSRRFLPAGEYRLRITGTKGGRQGIEEELPFLLSYR